MDRCLMYMPTSFNGLVLDMQNQHLLRTLAYIAAIIFFFIAIEHFTHETQPNGVGMLLPGFDHIDGRSLAEIPMAEFKKGELETPLVYVSRVTEKIYSATYHCLPTDNSLSMVEEAVSWAGKALGYDPQFDQGLFGFNRLKCGFCSERAAAVTHVLRLNGMDAITLGINGHVITKVTIDGAVYYTDPDYGVGPYLADLPADKIRKVYLQSVMPKLAGIVAEKVVDKSDDEPYYTDEYLQGLESLRSVIYLVSNIIGCLLLVGVLVCSARIITTTSGKGWLRQQPGDLRWPQGGQ